jgi:NAD(P)-dependent dehydrogenase (short-subunit alcohol dehydrogenase family)
MLRHGAYTSAATNREHPVERKVAFVTGASRGIGAATAVALARKGFDVVVTARTLKEGEGRVGRVGGDDDLRVPGSLETTAAAVRQQGREALPIRLDLLDRASLDAAVDAAEKEWGRIDLLVNNAIYQGPGTMSHVLDLDLDELARLYEGNVFAQIRLVQRVLPGMLERRSGTIVNLVSESGMMDPPKPAGEGGWGWAYSSSKAAFQRLIGVLKAEHPHDWLRLFNAEPGFTPTESMKARGMETSFEWISFGAPPEVCASVVAWLATDPGASEWHGKTVHTQKLCKRLGLIEGWPPA